MPIEWNFYFLELNLVNKTKKKYCCHAEKKAKKTKQDDEGKDEIKNRVKHIQNITQISKHKIDKTLLINKKEKKQSKIVNEN